MEKTLKALNYTPEMTAILRAEYLASPTKATVESLAEAMGKSVRSVVAKLSREKVYVTPVRVGKNGVKPIKKDTLADVIGSHVGMTEAEITSLTSANKTALTKLWDAINRD